MVCLLPVGYDVNKHSNILTFVDYSVYTIMLILL